MSTGAPIVARVRCSCGVVVTRPALVTHSGPVRRLDVPCLACGGGVALFDNLSTRARRRALRSLPLFRRNPR